MILTTFVSTHRPLGRKLKPVFLENKCIPSHGFLGPTGHDNGLTWRFSTPLVSSFMSAPSPAGLFKFKMKGCGHFSTHPFAKSKLYVANCKTLLVVKLELHATSFCQSFVDKCEMTKQTMQCIFIHSFIPVWRTKLWYRRRSPGSYHHKRTHDSLLINQS